MENFNEGMIINSKNETNQAVGKKLWNPTGFIFISILFSFLPAAILYIINFNRLGLIKKKKKAIITTCIVVAVITIIAILTYFNRWIYSTVLFGVNIAAGIYMRNDQSQLFKNHIANGEEKASFIIPVILILVLAFVLMVVLPSPTNTPDQKLMFKGSELYYSESVGKQEAEKLGNYLTNQGFFHDDRKVSVKIDKESNVYKLSLVINKEYINNKELEDSFKDMIKYISKDVFNNKRLDINLCDGQFKPLKTISGQI